MNGTLVARSMIGPASVLMGLALLHSSVLRAGSGVAPHVVLGGIPESGLRTADLSARAISEAVVDSAAALNLFHVSRSSVDQAPLATEAATPVPPQQFAGRLLGTTTGRDSAPFAVVLREDGPLLLRLGQLIDGFKVESIGRGRVVLTNGELRVVLQFEPNNDL